MNFKIEHESVFTILRVNLEKGESFRAEAGAMMSMSPSIQLEAKTTGKGLFGTLKAAVGGEGFFASLFTAVDGAGEVVLGPASPGDILKMELNNQTIYTQAGAYLAGSPNLELSTKGSAKALFSGEGLFLSKISGTGTLFVSSYGAIFMKELAPGERYIVDTGHIVAFEESINYTIKKAAKGIFSTVASGEGLVCEYVGPGKLWVQTRNIGALAKLLIPFLPKS
ncbi:MAG: TIGR00266 family protein [Bacteroidetes bacterium]|nr:MAG: TIGR00266 family protein [Bacteroidota bacterium]